ncbi:tyrosine-type recombinase/integrase [Microbacterium indicum]|uniref:tyrosine-type recombinase/integrase n=1 Tax=Microbacterium indicum TaxID=358100 RepID=UPI000401D598|nr:tyrosine-type recombinase/integrase [Microbacterium indicum]
MAKATRRGRREEWGSVRKLASGRIQARYQGPDGLHYTARTESNKPLTFGTLVDARAWLRGIRRSIDDGSWVSPATAERQREADEKQAAAERFDTYATTWIEQRRNARGEALRAKTRTEYLRQLSAGLSPFAGDRVRDITAARVRTWHAERARLYPTAAGAEARLLRAIFTTAVADGIAPANPVPNALTRTTTGITHRPPTSDELVTMLDAIPARFRLALELAAVGGLRLSEWRALERQDVTFFETTLVDDDGTSHTVTRAAVSVTRAAQWISGHGWVVGPPKSAEGVRTVPLPADVSQHLAEHLAEHVGDFPASLVFAPAGRSQYVHDREWARAWDVARDAAGVRRPMVDDDGNPTGRFESTVREHDLRAYAATAFTQSGATLRDAMAFLGHSTPAAAMVYQHTAADRLADLTAGLSIPTRRTPPRVTPITGTRP